MLGHILLIRAMLSERFFIQVCAQISMQPNHGSSLLEGMLLLLLFLKNYLL